MPGGDPQTTKIGFVVARATSTRSRVNGSLNMSTAPVIGTTSTSTAGSASIASRIWRPRSSATGGPPQSTGLETREVRGMSPSWSLLLRRRRERWQPQPGRSHEVGHVRAGAARDRVDARRRGLGRRHAGGFAGACACERGRRLEQLVEAVDAGDAELAERGRDDRVGAGEVPGVRLGHRARPRRCGPPSRTRSACAARRRGRRRA